MNFNYEYAYISSGNISILLKIYCVYDLYTSTYSCMSVQSNSNQPLSLATIAKLSGKILTYTMSS